VSRNDGGLNDSFEFKLGLQGNPHAAGGSTSAGNSLAMETMIVRSATNSRQRLQPATCARAASGSGHQAVLLNYNFHVPTLHDPSLRGGRRWMPAPLDFS